MKIDPRKPFVATVLEAIDTNLGLPLEYLLRTSGKKAMFPSRLLFRNVKVKKLEDNGTAIIEGRAPALMHFENNPISYRIDVSDLRMVG